MTPDRSLERLARRQHGLISTTQALDSGLSSRQIARRRERGQWRRIRRGVYVVAGAPASYDQSVLAAILAVAAPAWASHRTAAKLWGLPVRDPEAIDIVVGAGTQVRQRGVRGHRSARLPSPDLARVRSIPVTSPARTLVDLSYGLDERQFGRLVDRAERDGLCTIDAVARCVGRLDEGPGRSLAVVRRAMALRVPGYGPGDSDLEQDALAALAEAGLPLPERHWSVVLDGHRYVIDLAYPDQAIAIELLGFRDHGHRSALDDDSERTRRMILHGWTMLPFTSAASGPDLAADVGRLLSLRSAQGM